MLKKALLTEWGSAGGSRRVVYALHDGLENMNIETDILCHHYNPQSTLAKTEKELYFNTVDELMKNVNWNEYDVMNFHQCTFSKEELSKIKRPKTPFIYNSHSIIIHDLLNDPHKQNREYKSWFNSLPEPEKRKVIKQISDKYRQGSHFREADKVVLQTDYIKELFEYYYPDINGNRDVVINNGSYFHKFYGNRKVEKGAEEIREGLGKNNKLVLYCGRLSSEKGVQDIAKAFNTVQKLHPNSKLVVVGEGNRELITKSVNRENMKNVVFCGYVNSDEELAAYYRAGDVLVQPSYRETFCNSVLESMMMGTPVIASDADSMKELYIKSMLAYGVKPGSADGIAKWTDFIFSNPETARKNAERVRKVATEKYSFDRFLDSMIGLFHTSKLEKNRQN